MINIINETRYTFSGQPIPGTEEPQVSKIDIENSSLSELETELEKVSKVEFMLQMNDHWSSDDYILDRKYNQYMDELEEKIAALKGELQESKTLEEDIKEYDETAPIRAWIGNLGKYNEGELVGSWVSFPIDKDDLEKVLKDKVLIGTTDDFGQPYEEYGIFDWESDYIDYPGEYANLDEINEWAEKVDELKDWEKDTFEAANEAGLVDNILDFDADDYVLLTGIDDDEDLGYYYVDNLYNGDVSQIRNAEDYFDYDALGRELGFETYENPDYDEDDPDSEETILAGEYWCGDENATDSEIGAAYIDNVGFDGVQNKEAYFDYEDFGRYCAEGGYFTEKGFIYEV